MIDCTDQYFRQLIRLISKKVFLYTEMITAHALMHGDAHKLLAFNSIENPIALQLGGSDPVLLAEAAEIAQQFNYNEINLNVGCPSPRVQAGRFGACLMKEPALVAQCVEAMQSKVKLPVTVKTRIGVDEFDSFDFFNEFVSIVKNSGCQLFIIHARKAWLKGLSPKQNRTIPELKYIFVDKLKQQHPELEIIVNGGIIDLDKDKRFNHLDGIMVGREAYNNPYHLLNVDHDHYQQTEGKIKTRKELLIDYRPYAAKALEEGFPPSILLKHLYGLSHGIVGGSKWRSLCTLVLREAKPFDIHDFDEVINQFPSNL